MIVPSTHHRRLLLSSITLLFLTLTCSQFVKAQSCDNVPEGSGESMSAYITPETSETKIGNDSVVTAGTRVLLHSRATANGQCVGKAWGNCNPSPCECIETGYVYQRTINHTNVYVDISSSGALNGTYSAGTVWFLIPMTTFLTPTRLTQPDRTYSRSLLPASTPSASKE
jgi:hypothetical protein